MTEIKFRVWCKDYNEWEKDRCFLSPDGVVYQMVLAERVRAIRPENHVVQLFTGLKDKNGKEIYEGDILERIGNGSFCKIVIYWDEQNCRFISKNSFNLHGEGSPISNNNINISDWTYWVVCGNIYENPELLKQ